MVKPDELNVHSLPQGSTSVEATSPDSYQEIDLALGNPISNANSVRAIFNSKDANCLSYSIFGDSEPTAQEQYMLELINRMRMNPVAELALLINASEQNIKSAIEYFNVNRETVVHQWSALTPVQPLAWSAELKNAAVRNNQLQLRNRTTGHYSGGCQNAFAHAKSVLYGHAAFGIDWGDEKTGDNNRDGIQDGFGHRENIMSGSHRGVGISIISANELNAEIGPLLITQNFNGDSGQPWLVGVVYKDPKGDKCYAPGRGLKGIKVEVSRQSSNQRFTTSTNSTGGYQIRLERGVYAVTFSGDVLNSDFTMMVTIREENVKVDVPVESVNSGSNCDLADDGEVPSQSPIKMRDNSGIQDEPARAGLMHYAPLYDAPDLKDGNRPAAGRSALAGMTDGGEPRVDFVSEDGHVHELAWRDGNWHHLVVSAAAGGPPAAAGGSALTGMTYGGDPRVYYVAEDRHVHELAWWGGNWHHLVVSAAAGGPPAAAGISALTGMTYGGDPRVYYVAEDRHVHELAWWGGNWHHLPVSEIAGGPQVAFTREGYNSPLMGTTYRGDPRVYYLADNLLDDRNLAGQLLGVHELAWRDGSWHHRVVSEDAGAPFADIRSPLMGMTYGDDQRVYYLADESHTPDRHICELARRGSSWHHCLVSEIAGGPPASYKLWYVSSLTGMTYRGDPRVYYLAEEDGHVHELAWWGGTWHHLVVSAAAGGPPAAARSALTGMTYRDDPRVYYVAEDRHVHELSWRGGNWYHNVILDNQPTVYIPNYTHGHNVLFKKAVDYLKEQDTALFAASYPLDQYLPIMARGSAYADNSGPPYDWWAFQGRGDQIHHYGRVGEIEFQSNWIAVGQGVGYSIAGWSVFGPLGAILGGLIGASDDRVTVGHTGGYAAPYYAHVLYELALKFWPEGDKPLLSELPVKDAGFADVPVPFYDKASYGETRVGGYPLAPASSPRWPDWQGVTDEEGNAVQSWMNSLMYLGWAIHLLQDVTVPQNAANYADNESNTFEHLVSENILYNLPSGPLELTFDSIEDLGQQVVNISAGRAGEATEENVRRQADLAIQVTVAVIDKFFQDLEDQPALRMKLETLYRRKEEFERSHPGVFSQYYVNILKALKEIEDTIQARLENLTRIHGRKVDLVPRRIVVKERSREFMGRYLAVGVQFQNVGNKSFEGDDGEVEIGKWPEGERKLFRGSVYAGGRPGEYGGQLGEPVRPGEYGVLWCEAPLGSFEPGTYVFVHLDRNKTMQPYRVDENDEIFHNDSARLLVEPVQTTSQRLDAATAWQVLEG